MPKLQKRSSEKIRPCKHRGQTTKLAATFCVADRITH